jgi:arginine exporter protein ArgO
MTPDDAVTETTLTLLLLDIALIVVGIVVVGALLVRASRYGGAARFIGPLAILSGVALVLGAATEHDAMMAIAAGGIGALGATLQTVVKKDDEPDSNDKTDRQNPDERN